MTKPWDLGELRGVIRQAVERSSELRKETGTAFAAERRNQLLAALEREYPGITAVNRVGGDYKIDAPSVEAALAKLPAPRLRALWESPAGG